MGAVFDPETGAVIEGELAMPALDVAPNILYDRGRFLLIRDSRVTVWKRIKKFGIDLEAELEAQKIAT